MAKFKVGDIVKLVDGLEVDVYYGAISYRKGMRLLEGNKALTIDKVDIEEDGEAYYVLAEDPYRFWFSECMLEISDVKKLTMAELREIVGEDFVIVEE